MHVARLRGRLDRVSTDRLVAGRGDRAGPAGSRVGSAGPPRRTLAAGGPHGPGHRRRTAGAGRARRRRLPAAGRRPPRVGLGEPSRRRSVAQRPRGLALHGARRDLQQRGGLRLGQVLVEAQHQHRPLPGRAAPAGAARARPGRAAARSRRPPARSGSTSVGRSPCQRRRHQLVEVLTRTRRAYGSTASIPPSRFQAR